MNFFVVSLIKTAVVAAVLLTTLAYLQWIERKVLAHIQLRLGPSRVGPHGLLQPLADVIKLFTKEDFVPTHVNHFFYFLAPFWAVSLALITICVIPFGPEISVGGVKTWMQLTDLNIGILLFLAVSSMSVYGVALAGWASNNKYSLLGGLRSSAQMISYELPLGLSIAAPLLLVNSLSLRQIVEGQGATQSLLSWNVFALPFPQIFSFLIFLIAGFAETNRVPFDLPEAENELVGGFHTEYSSMKFASFFMAEYANIITITCIGTTLFLGGWQPLFPARYGSNFVPSLLFAAAGAIALFHGLQPARKWDRYTFPAVAVLAFLAAALFLIPSVQYYLLPIFWFAFKTSLLLFVFIWIRGTMPRFRYDQLMRFAWGFLFPAALLNLLVTSLMVALFPGVK